MPIYLDTSVLVGFVFGEAGWRDATDVIARHQSRWLSHFAWGEFIDTLARTVRQGEQSTKAAQATASGVRRFFSAWSWAASQAEDVIDAAQLIEKDFRLPLKFPDAIHLATARRIGAVLLTFDRQQASAARAFGIDCINPREEKL